MSETEPRSLLSREELQALLTELRSEAGERGRPSEGDGPRLGRWARLLGEFAEDQSRALSTLHQRSIELELIEMEELDLREFAAMLLPTDLVAELELQPGDHRLYLLLGRSLVYAWLALAFGARADTPSLPVPARPYSRIEERFLRRAAGDLVRQLQTTWSFRSAVTIRVVDLLEPGSLEPEPAPFAMASFDVTGLGDPCRLRILLPSGLYAVEKERESRDVVERRQHLASGLERAVLEVAVRVRAEAGYADLPLRRVAGLQVGDLLPLEPSDPRGLVVRIEEEPKYVAERGSVGGRLAIQLIESL